MYYNVLYCNVLYCIVFFCIVFYGRKNVEIFKKLFLIQFWNFSSFLNES